MMLRARFVALGPHPLEKRSHLARVGRLGMVKTILLMLGKTKMSACVRQELQKNALVVNQFDEEA